MSDDDVITNAEAVRLYHESLRRLTDQPVTPDQEARLVLTHAKGHEGYLLESWQVEVLLPYLAVLIDQARQEGREQAAEAVLALPAARYDAVPHYGNPVRTSREEYAAAARGADRKDEG